MDELDEELDIRQKLSNEFGQICKEYKRRNVSSAKKV